MSESTVRPYAGRLLLVASVMSLVACGGNTAGPEAPNPLGVPDTIVLAISSTEVVIGDTLRLSVVARDAGGTVVPNVTLIWRSLTPSVATVSADGLVTTLDIGEAEIDVEATVPGSSFALSIDSTHIGTTALRKVRSKFKIVSIPKVVITPGSATINVKEAQLFNARITNMNDIELRNRPETRWSSSNPAVATIDAAGIATALTKGTTTITATVTVGASSSVRKTATLTVSEPLCGGIALVETLQGTVSYDYAVGGTIGDSRIASEYHGQVKATMTNTGWQPASKTVLWFGPLSGSASQVETVHAKSGAELQRMQGAGSVIPGPNASLAFMAVQVDLMTCTYNVLVEVAIDLTWILGGTPLPIPPGSARVYIGSRPLSLGAGQANPFPIGTDLELPGHSNGYDVGHPMEDAFMPHGIVAQLVFSAGLAGLGKADANYVITPVRP